MLPEESLNRCIEQLSALPPRKRMEAFRSIEDPAARRQVARTLPPKIFGEILDESMLDSLRRNVQEQIPVQKPSQAA